MASIVAPPPRAADPLMLAVHDLAAAVHPAGWSGSATNLLRTLGRRGRPEWASAPNWPASPPDLLAQLAEVRDDLLAIGVTVGLDVSTATVSIVMAVSATGAAKAARPMWDLARALTSFLCGARTAAAAGA